MDGGRMSSCQEVISVNAKQLIDEAVSLPIEERALVVDSLLKSFSLSSAHIDQQWLAVARTRLREMRTGDVKPVPGEDVFSRIWNKREK